MKSSSSKTQIASARRGRRLTAYVTAGFLVVSGCTATGGDDGPSDDAVPDLGGESPILAEAVEAGDLPPVEERLPAEPLVVEPHERIGQYGGAWRSAMPGPDNTVWLDRTIGYDDLVRWVPEWTGAGGDTEVTPNVAESYEVSEDATEYTFTLREGTRWSDGELFTTSDIEFAYELLTDPEQPPVPDAFTAGGEVADLHVEDDLTFILSFAEPQGILVPFMAEGSGLLLRPRHYLEQFHPEYAEDIDEVLAEEGYSHWVELMEAKTNPYTHTELPTLNAWAITQAIGDGNVVTAERNPYYWKTDPEGNQLPYLDEVRFDMLSDDELMLAAAMQGDLDLHTAHFTSPVNRPVLAASRDEGDYDFVDLVPGLANELVIHLNLTTEDEVLREIFNNRDFRVGLSHAIDRDELINSVYQRQGRPSQVAPQPESAFYNEKLATQFTEFDVDLANEYLDSAGYTERDSQDRRLGPEGEPISFSVEHAGSEGFDDALALISDNWAEVGITMTPDFIDRSLYEERRRANTPDASVWQGGGGVDVIQNPFWYLPVHSRADYAQLWFEWYQTDGDSGVEPPEGTQRQFELYGDLQRTADVAEQEQLMAEILDIAADEFYHIGTVQSDSAYGIVRNNFHNVPSSGMPDIFRARSPALTNPEQYFVSGG